MLYHNVTDGRTDGIAKTISRAACIVCSCAIINVNMSKNNDMLKALFDLVKISTKNYIS